MNKFLYATLAAIASSCSSSQIEYTQRRVVATVIDKSEVKDYSSDDSLEYRVSLSAKLGGRVYLFDHYDKELHKAVHQDSLTDETYEEMHKVRYNREQKVADKMTAIIFKRATYRQRQPGDSIYFTIKALEKRQQ